MKLNDEKMKLLEQYLWTKTNYCLNSYNLYEGMRINYLIMSYHKQLKGGIKERKIINGLEQISTEIHIEMLNLSKHQQNFKKFRIILKRIIDEL